MEPALDVRDAVALESAELGRVVGLQSPAHGRHVPAGVPRLVEREAGVDRLALRVDEELADAIVLADHPPAVLLAADPGIGEVSAESLRLHTDRVGGLRDALASS